MGWGVIYAIKFCSPTPIPQSRCKKGVTSDGFVPSVAEDTNKKNDYVLPILTTFPWSNIKKFKLVLKLSFSPLILAQAQCSSFIHLDASFDWVRKGQKSTSHKMTREMESRKRHFRLYAAFVFLDAFTHLYKRVCQSVRPSVCPSVTYELNFWKMRPLGASVAWNYTI